MLHEKPDQLVQSSIDSFEIEPDLLTLQRIEDKIKKTQAFRKTMVDKLTAENRRLQTQVDRLKAEVDDLTKGHSHVLDDVMSEQDFAESDNVFSASNRKLQALDNEKLSLAKKLNDYESKTNSLTIEKARLQEQHQQLTADLNNMINLNILNNPNSNVIKINLYKSFGVSVDFEADQDKVLVVNNEGLTSILKVEDKYSDYFVSNWIWDRI